MDSDKTIKFLENVVQLVQEDEEVFASIGLNPTITLIKFILTDDKPNNNGIRIPKEEFPNLISTGLYMPLKMAQGEPGDHEEAFPIGVITHLKEVADKVRGLAVLWNMERTFDIDLIRERYSNDQPLNISWEILHKDSFMEDDVENLTGVYLRAATLVDIPAYGGRTQVTEVISSEEDNIPKEDKPLTKELEKNVELLEAAVTERDEKIASHEATIVELTASQVTDEITKELDELRDFKKEVEEEKETQERKSALRDKFIEEGIEKDDEYFEENEEMLLNLDEAALDFVVKQEATIAEASKEEPKKKTKEKKSSLVPNLKGDEGSDDGDIDLDDLSPKELGKALRESKAQQSKGGSN